MRCLILALICLTAFAGEAGGMRSADSMDEEERAQKSIDSFQAEAATYRLARAKAVRSDADDRAAEAGLAKAKEMRAHGGRAWYHLWFVGKVTRARWISEDAFEDHPYAAPAGRLIHFGLDCHAENKEVKGVLDKLMMLWFYLPEYDDLGKAMTTALNLAEKVQDFQTHVDLEADEPSKVVSIDGHGWLSEANELFLFLKNHGDRLDIAPRAALGMARSLLLSGEREDRWLARRAYESFLEDYPDSPLVFDAILEQALSYLSTYKGDDYDVGALIDAKDLVDLAELEVAGIPERSARIESYRKRIRAWLQDRDLSVARWYRERGQPRFLAWLRCPPDLKDWAAGSRYYYKSVIARDRLSKQALAAERELARLPSENIGLGKPITR